MRKQPIKALRSPEGIAHLHSVRGAEKWDLRLYVAGQTPRSIVAFANLKHLCEEHLAGRYNIEIIDLIKHPDLAAADQILAIPTLVRKLPPPIRKIVGDLRDTERTLVGLQLRPSKEKGPPGMTYWK